MPSILTPKRRQLTRRVARSIYKMSLAWAAKTGATSINTNIGLSIRRGMLQMELERLAIERNQIPTGIIKVPRMQPRPPGAAGGLMVAGGMPGFVVNLDDLRQSSSASPWRQVGFHPAQSPHMERGAIRAPAWVCAGTWRFTAQSAQRGGKLPNTDMNYVR